MNREEKSILIKDLCARIPYGVHAAINNKHQEYKGELLGIRQGGYYQMFFANGEWYRIEVIKPYLFPMSSITDEQREELEKMCDCYDVTDLGIRYSEGGTLEDYYETIPFALCSELVDWLNEHHFDHRGLIDKGLAIDATNLNIY